MRRYNIAATPGTLHAFKSKRVVVDLNKADLTSVSAVVMTADEALSGQLERVEATAFGIPVILLNNGAKLPTELFGKVVSVINSQPDNVGLYGRLIDAAAQKYEDQILPPFFGKMESYVRNGNVHFDCPGHQGGAFFRRHPAGRQFADFFGENVFRSDLCNADVAMGDLLIHEGVPRAAQMAAAKIYNADKTYFVLNGTSASNKVVLNALLTPGDLVLFDRNNHKSNHHGALIQAGATPVYLETARNSYGFTCASSSARLRPSAPMKSARFASPSSSLAPTTARSTTPVRWSTASAACATTSSSTPPGSATNSSSR